jgi:hypothetical protein
LMRTRSPRSPFKLVGTSDAVTVCDRCGRADLDRTLVIEHEGDPEPLYYGSECAAKVLGANDPENLERAARRMPKQSVKLLGPDRAPAHIQAELAPAVDRAIASGARTPLTFVGVGMTGIVFTDKHKIRAFKVARHEPAKNTMREEVEWFRAASRDPFVSKHVLPRVKWDEKTGVRVSPLMRGEHPRSWGGQEIQVRELHEQIGKYMLKRGWTAPEYKPDSYIMTRTGPVLVDASMPQRVGRTLVRYADDILEGRRQPYDDGDTPNQLAFYVRREIKTDRNPKGTIELTEGLAALARLKEHGATEWTDL